MGMAERRFTVRRTRPSAAAKRTSADQRPARSAWTKTSPAGSPGRGPSARIPPQPSSARTDWPFSMRKVGRPRTERSLVHPLEGGRQRAGEQHLPGRVVLGERGAVPLRDAGRWRRPRPRPCPTRRPARRPAATDRERPQVAPARVEALRPGRSGRRGRAALRRARPRRWEGRGRPRPPGPGFPGGRTGPGRIRASRAPAPAPGVDPADVTWVPGRSMAGRSGAAATVGSMPPVMAAAAASGTQSAGRSSAQTSTIPRSESFPASTATSSTRWSGTRLGPRMTREYFPGGSSRRKRPPVSLFTWRLPADDRHGGSRDPGQAALVAEDAGDRPLPFGAAAAGRASAARRANVARRARGIGGAILYRQRGSRARQPRPGRVSRAGSSSRRASRAGIPALSTASSAIGRPVRTDSFTMAAAAS